MFHFQNLRLNQVKILREIAANSLFSFKKSVDKNFFRDNMAKRTRHPQGFHASLFDLRDHSFTSKYRPRAKPSVMGVSKF